ncbi:hypothetical protein M6D93_09670 [Jatrophihabitans telluris]|uniref:VOC domain-containing protein n=1 Tax=Jatrophihabitans telluris TaxID=2038343 RepID=A0ABY4R338_9ACTN|nr:VOC family protein [Jatrophihabitans telluris]UQX90248.1 hypothetical protein M6D93_09670 [Jatrophihabitans telluris]
MDFKLELVVLPVSDVDVAKDFYVRAGFRLDVDHRGENFRVVQLTPPGSACSISLMHNPDAAGTLNGLHLVVSDMAAARAALQGGGVDVGEPFHFTAAGQVPGPDPSGADFGTFAALVDPDGNSFMLQEVPSRAGR